MNITEDYVSFETAKLLKEKGFDEKLQYYYDTDGILVRCHRGQYFSNKSNAFIAPTQAMAMKWLREIHHVACFICPSIEQGFHTNKWNSYIDKLSDNFPKDPLWFVETSDSYEQACESAIKYCLEHLI